MKQSFSLWAYSGRGVDDETLMKEAKAIGYDGIELLPRERFQPAIDC